MANAIAQSVLDFWFTSEPLAPADAQARMPFWFGTEASSNLDYDIERRFGKLVSMAAKGSFSAWKNSADELLALVILLDQFPRNLYRNSPKAFATDGDALALTKFGLSKNYQSQLSPIHASFLLMPFQHCENLNDQNEGLEAYAALASNCSEEWTELIEGIGKYAKRHQAVIEKFGRFPHRNAVLDREPTPEEQAYLDAGGDRF